MADGANATRTEWRVAAASQTGRSHAARQSGCQDAVHWRRVGAAHDLLVAAVADGASSAVSGRAGADVAALSAVETLDEWWTRGGRGGGGDDDWPEAMRNALSAARAAVLDEAAMRGADPDDLASTLLIVAVGPDRVAAAQIGDGAVVVADEAGRLATITAPARGEFANTTTFLTTPDSLDSAQVVAWPGRVADVAAFTDGLQMLALDLPGGQPHAPFFRPLFRMVRDADDESAAVAGLAAFLSSPRVAERTDDDLTLFLGVRGPSAGAATTS